MQPRQVLLKDEHGSNENSDGAASSSSKLNKRKTVSSACVPCRKRKSKCDGGQPSCSTCMAVYRTECQYDTDADHRRRPTLRKDIQSLQVQNSALDVIVNSLRSLPEPEATALFHSIRNGERHDSIAESLVANPSTSQDSQVMDADLNSRSRTSSTTSFPPPFMIMNDASTAYQDRRESSQTPQQRLRQNSGPWFSTPQDAEYVDHLLNLYFAWHHPFYAVFSKPHFLKDMQKGRTSHCSAMLINAVLSMACQYSDRPSSPSHTTPGDAFFAEARELANVNDEASLTTVQALAVMSLRETCCKRGNSGYRWAGRAVRMAFEMGLHLSTEAGGETGLRQLDVELRKLTFWGVHNVEIMSALAIGRMSQIPSVGISVEKPANIDSIDSLIWQPYEDVNMPVSPGAQHAMHCLQFVEQLSVLCQLLNEINLTLYAPLERLTPRKLAAAHARYQSWYQNLPEVFHLCNTGMPHVLVLHMYYHKSRIHLFRPFLQLDLSAAGLDTRQMCSYAATEISTLMSALRGMYGFRRICMAAVPALTSAITIHMLELPSQIAIVNTSQGFSDLAALAVHYPLATRCLETLRSLAGKWNIALPESAKTNFQLRMPDSRMVSPTSQLPMTIFHTQATLISDVSDSMQGSGPSNFADSVHAYNPSYMGQDFSSACPQAHMANAPQDAGNAQQMLWSAYTDHGLSAEPADYQIMVDQTQPGPFEQYGQPQR